MFIFDGDVLDDEQVASIRLADGELAAFDYCMTDKAAERLRPYMFRRVTAALEVMRTKRVVYLQDGYRCK
jgi:8-oxo-dGTP diphosphatase